MSYVEDVARQISAKLAARLNIPEPPQAWRAFAAQVRVETAGGDPSTRGVRDNNPLNLRPAPAGTWAGQVGVDRDAGGPFSIFSSTEAGVDAAVQNLLAPDYERVRNSFRFGDPVALAHSIEASPWDAGGYSNNLASMIPASGDTYIGGGTSSSIIGDHPTPSPSPAAQSCGIGFVWDPATGKCRNANVTDVFPNLYPDIGKAAGDAVNSALGPIGSAITGVGDRALTGTRQLIIAGVVIAAIAALSVAGVRRTLP